MVVAAHVREAAERQLLEGPDELPPPRLEPPDDALATMLEGQEVPRVREEPRQLRVVEVQKRPRKGLAQVPGLAVEQQKPLLGAVQPHQPFLQALLQRPPQRQLQPPEPPLLRLRTHESVPDPLREHREPRPPRRELRRVVLLERNPRLTKPVLAAAPARREPQQPQLLAPLQPRTLPRQLPLPPLREEQVDPVPPPLAEPQTPQVVALRPSLQQLNAPDVEA